MNHNYFNPTGLFDPNNSILMDNIFNTDEDCTNIAYPFIRTQTKNFYYMEEEPNLYISRSYQNTKANVWNDNPPEIMGFFINYENFLENLDSDNLFRIILRNNHQTQRQMMGILQQNSENLVEFDIFKNTNNPTSERENNMEELKKRKK